MLAGSYDDDRLHDSGNDLPFAFPPSAAAPFDASFHPDARLRWHRWHLQSLHQPSLMRPCLPACGPRERLLRRSTALGRDLSRCSLVYPGSLSLSDYCLDVDVDVALGDDPYSCHRNKAPCRLRSIGASHRQTARVWTASLQAAVALASVPARVPGSECDWEWERKWKLMPALARKRDTILRRLSLRRTARVDSALLGRLERLGCLFLDQRVGLPCYDSRFVVVRFWESTVYPGEIRIDLSIYDGAWVAGVVVAVAAAADGDDEMLGKSLVREVAVAFLDRSSPTSRRCTTRVLCPVVI